MTALFVERLIVSAIILLLAAATLRITWTKEISLVARVSKKIESYLPTVEPDLAKEHESKVNITLTRSLNGKLSLFLRLDHSIDKIGDIALSIDSTTDSSIALKNIRGFTYFKETLIHPLIAFKEIDASIAEVPTWIKDPKDWDIVLKWRDGENKQHTKRWPYERYKMLSQTLRENGWVKDPNHDNVFLAEVTL